jgi:hypothetical protein
MHRGLMAFSAACAMSEAAILTLVAPAARALSPQVTAPPPLAVFHDLRWLFGNNRSWGEFVAGAVLLIIGRSGVNTMLTLLAWPKDLPRPRVSAIVRTSLAFTLLAGLLMVPIVTLMFGVAVLPFSWPFLAAMPVMLAIALPLSHGGVTSAWWRRLPPARAVGWALACFLEYSLAGTLIARLPTAGIIVVAGLAGVVNARAWYGLTAAVARPARTRPRPSMAWIPVAPLAAVSTIVLAVGAARLIFQAGAVPSAAPGIAAASAGIVAAAGSTSAAAAPGVSGPRHAVLVISGFGSSCCQTADGLQQADTGMLVQQFSYQGLNAAGKPVPQGPTASDMPLPRLGDMIAAQVQRLYQQTGRPVDLVAESEGTLGVYAMFARHPNVPVGSIVLLSPIVAPGQISFPDPGQQGPGMVSGYALRALDSFVGGLSQFGTSGAQRLLTSVSSVGASYAASASHGKARRWLALVPLADAVTLPVCSLPENVVIVPAFHGGLLGDPPVLTMVTGFLAGHSVSALPDMREAAELVTSAALAWRMPQIAAPSGSCPG